MDKARCLIFNLKDPNNPDLRKRVLTQWLDPAALVEVDSKLLASNSKIEAREKSQKDNLQSRRTDWFREQA